MFADDPSLRSDRDCGDRLVVKARLLGPKTQIAAHIPRELLLVTRTHSVSQLRQTDLGENAPGGDEIIAGLESFHDLEAMLLERHVSPQSVRAARQR